MKWISVKEQLPGEDEWVLVSDSPYLGKSIYIARRIYQELYDDVLQRVVPELVWEKDWCCQQGMCSVLFWMPLPVVPKEKE